MNHIHAGNVNVNDNGVNWYNTFTNRWYNNFCRWI